MEIGGNCYFCVLVYKLQILENPMMIMRINYSYHGKVHHTKYIQRRYYMLIYIHPVEILGCMGYVVYGVLYMYINTLDSDAQNKRRLLWASIGLATCLSLQFAILGQVIATLAQIINVVRGGLILWKDRDNNQSKKKPIFVSMLVLLALLICYYVAVFARWYDLLPCAMSLITTIAYWLPAKKFYLKKIQGLVMTRALNLVAMLVMIAYAGLIEAWATTALGFFASMCILASILFGKKK